MKYMTNSQPPFQQRRNLTDFGYKRKSWLLSLLLLPSLFAGAWTLDSLTGICPQPVNCTPGTNFLTLADANYCGCCGCHGGAVGCSGGAKGRIICQDGTTASACFCQYTVTDP